MSDKNPQDAVSAAVELDEGQLDQVAAAGTIGAGEPPEPGRIRAGEPPDPGRTVSGEPPDPVRVLKPGTL